VGSHSGPCIPEFFQRRQQRARYVPRPSSTRPLAGVTEDADDLASATKWVASEIVETVADLGREVERHEASARAIAEEARLPTSFLLSSSIVAVPALLEAHAAAENELQMPGPRTFFANAAFLLGSVVAVVIWLCASAIAFTAPRDDSSEAFQNYYEITLAWLQSVPAAAWAAYQSALLVQPVFVKALLTGVTYVCGDMIAQVVQQTSEVTRQQLRPRPLLEKCLRMDQTRYTRSGLVGFFPLGPLAHFYYDFVSARLDEWPTACKIALDQTLYLATYNTVYFVGLGVLARRPLGEVVAQYRQQFWQLLTAGWRIWPLVGIVTYTYIPTEHRVLFVDLVEILYSAVLSTITSDAHAGYTAVSSNAEATPAGLSGLGITSPLTSPRNSGQLSRSISADRLSSTARLSLGGGGAILPPELDIELGATRPTGFDPSCCAAHQGRAQFDRSQDGPAAMRSPQGSSLAAAERAPRPRTWEELVERGGPGAACYWCIAGTLPDGLDTRGASSGGLDSLPETDAGGSLAP